MVLYDMTECFSVVELLRDTYVLFRIHESSPMRWHNASRDYGITGWRTLLENGLHTYE